MRPKRKRKLLLHASADRPSSPVGSQAKGYTIMCR